LLSERDARDLKRLEIAYYVAATIQVGVVAYTWYAMNMQLQAELAGSGLEGDERRMVETIFTWMTIAVTSLAALLILTLLGASLLVRLRKARTALYVLTGINCVFSPPGIFVGIATLILLQRPGIADAFRPPHERGRPGDVLHVE